MINPEHYTDHGNPDGDMTTRFMNVRQVAGYLQLNEKKIYALVSEGKIPGTKITGKWMFPRTLIDRWLMESSHGGLLTDRLILAGSDDPLVQRAILQLADTIQDHALVSYTCTGTRLGLGLLAQHRVDVCAMHWGPYEESGVRHPALLKQFPQHHDWVLVRICRREQGFIISPKLLAATGVEQLLGNQHLRWTLRQAGAGSQRFMQETLARAGLNENQLNCVATAYSEREAASMIAMGLADIAPGTRSAASEFGLKFIPAGWECFDLALYRGVYFRTLFQQFLEHLRSPECQVLATTLGGYDFTELGRLIWAE